MRYVISTLLATSTLTAGINPVAVLSEKLAAATESMRIVPPVIDPREPTILDIAAKLGHGRNSLQLLADLVTTLTGAPAFTLSAPAPTAFTGVPGGVVVKVRDGGGYRTGVPMMLVKTGAGSIVGLRTVDGDGLPFLGSEARQGSPISLSLVAGNGLEGTRLATAAEIQQVAETLLTAPMSRINAEHLLNIMGIDLAVLPAEGVIAPDVVA